ncbi:MAG: PD40 domain-containing protein [Gemmatimonadetes bacterium]|nr:PD40 domain-containing protein [Gemmatimonadota bacterium]
MRRRIRLSALAVSLGFLLVPSPLAAVQDREIRVTVEEGTNIAAALSPDGSRLVIDLQGRLWILPAAGGEARTITDELGDARQPAWSPDGRLIAFQSFRDGGWHIWVVGAGGEGLRQLTFGPFDDREPHWSPDGRRIVFASDRSGNYDVWELAIESGALRQLTTDAADDFHPAWSPDGRELAFVSTRRADPGIWIRAGAGAERLAARAAGQVAAPSWSPDGRRLLFNVVERGESRLLSVEVTAPGATPPGARAESERGEDVFPFRVAWLSAGEFLYTADGAIKRRTLAGGSATAVPFRASFAFSRAAYERRRYDFDSAEPRPVRGIVRPAVSPAGDRIAFTALGDLWLLDTRSGGEPRRLTRDPYVDGDPAWSPDGRRLAYASDRAGSLDIWVRDVASGQDLRLTELAGSEVAPAWSPDGSRIAFLAVQGLGSDVVVVDVASRELRTVRRGLFGPGRPTWSADGATLAVAVLRPYSARYREGRNEVLLVSLRDGAERTMTPYLAHSSVGTRGADGPAWSPDGRRMAFVADGALWVVPVAADGQPIGPPRRLADELADAPTWTGDSRNIVYQTSEGLRRVSLDDGRIDEIPLRLAWRPALPAGQMVVHAARLFDGRSPEYRRNVDIVIEGQRIREVRPHATHAPGARILDASRGAVIPGLIEMHTHQGYGFGEVLGRIWLAYGVTSVREPSADPFEALERREAIAAGVRVGPREFFTGRTFDGTRIYYAGSLALDGGTQLPLELERARTLGYDLIKTYVRLPDVLQRRVIEYAHAHGLPVSSHELYPGVAFGADHVEHIRGTSRRGYSPKVTLLNRSYRDVIQLVAASGMTITPTVGIYGGFPVILARDPSVLEEARFTALFTPGVAASLRQSAEEARRELPARMALVTPLGRTVLEVVRAGGRVIAGTDSPIIPYALSLQTELEHFVDGGLSPFEALRAATAVSAEALGAGADLGTVEPGKLADLVVVDGDPLKEIRAARRVRTVIKNGELYELEALLRRP